MNRLPLAVAALLALSAAAGCAPQCTCPATGPATPAPPPVPAAAPAAPPAAAPPAAQPPAPAAQPAAPAPVRLLNGGPASRRMRSLYPQHLYDAGVRGDVVLDLTLSAEGTVETAVDVEATNDQFRAPAVTVARELRFSAPSGAGTQLRIRMRFQPSGGRIDIVQP